MIEPRLDSGVEKHQNSRYEVSEATLDTESRDGFYDVLAQVLAILQSRGHVTYRALKQQFNLDDDFLEALKAEII